MELNDVLILKKIEKNKSKLKKKGVKKLGLFGSFLKGETKKNSDIDLLVEFDRVDIDRYLYVLTLLEKMFKREIDLVIEKDLKPELKHVKKEAKYVKI